MALSVTPKAVLTADVRTWMAQQTSDFVFRDLYAALGLTAVEARRHNIGRIINSAIRRGEIAIVDIDNTPKKRKYRYNQTAAPQHNCRGKAGAEILRAFYVLETFCVRDVMVMTGAPSYSRISHHLNKMITSGYVQIIGNPAKRKRIHHVVNRDRYRIEVMGKIK